MGLERHEGKWLMTKCSFWGGATLSQAQYIYIVGGSLGSGSIPSSEPSLWTARQICILIAQSNYMLVRTREIYNMCEGPSLADAGARCEVGSRASSVCSPRDTVWPHQLHCPNDGPVCGPERESETADCAGHTHTHTNTHKEKERLVNAALQLL